MAIRFVCPHCCQPGSIPSRMSGKNIRTSCCGQTVRVKCAIDPAERELALRLCDLVARAQECARKVEAEDKALGIQELLNADPEDLLPEDRAEILRHAKRVEKRIREYQEPIFEALEELAQDARCYGQISRKLRQQILAFSSGIGLVRQLVAEELRQLSVMAGDPCCMEELV